MRPNFGGQYSPTPPKPQVDPVISQDRAAYRILKECFLDDIMFFPGQLVYWDEEPNKEMQPMNGMAKKASNAFFDKCEREGQKKAAKNSMRYVPLRRPVEEDRALANADLRRVEIVKGDGGVPVMGARKRGRPKAEAITNLGVEVTPIVDADRKSKGADLID